MLLKILPQKCMSVAKEGKFVEQKKLLQPLLDTFEGTKITWISLFFTSPTPTVYSSAHLVSDISFLDQRVIRRNQ